MMNKNLTLLFERDISKIKTEILAYTEEGKIWQTYTGISNSGGNLCLHLLGNLQYYIGNVLGKTGYIRNRPAEFSLKNIPVKELTVMIETTLVAVVKTIASLDAGTMEKEYPEKVFNDEMTVEYFLLHLLAHLNYHLGQINYHRRSIG